MYVEKKVERKRKVVFLGIIQYMLAFLIGILFLYGFFEPISSYFYILTFVLLIQFIISLLRLRIFNILFEVILFIMVLLAFIPVLGLIFLLAGFLISMFDLMTFGLMKSYRSVTIKKFHNKPKNKRKDYVDVDFEEK